MVPHLEGDFHLDILVEPAENRDHAIEREAPQLRIADARKLGMRDAGQLLGLARREVPRVEIANDRGGDERPRLLEAGVRTAEVAVDVAAAAHEFEIVGHFSASFNRFSLSRMTSISTCGVLTPDLDFFWKAWMAKYQRRSSPHRSRETRRPDGAARSRRRRHRRP